MTLIYIYIPKQLEIQYSALLRVVQDFVHPPYSGYRAHLHPPKSKQSNGPIPIKGYTSAYCWEI